MHGVFLHHGLWAAQLAALSDVRRCLAPDLLAHGGSALAPAGGEPLDLRAQARMIIDFLDALGVYQADLVGNDTGGAICQVAAAMAPDRFRSLTLTNCDVHDNWPPPPFMPIVNLARQGVLATALPTLAGTAIRSDRPGLQPEHRRPSRTWCCSASPRSPTRARRRRCRLRSGHGQRGDRGHPLRSGQADCADLDRGTNEFFALSRAGGLG